MLLAEYDPVLAEQLVDKTLAATLTYGSGRRVEWECDLGHRWSNSVNGRTYKGSGGCPICSGKILLVGFNDISTTRPDLADQLADPSLKHKISSGSNVKTDWVCSIGHRWRVSPNSRNFFNTGCPVCSGSMVLPGFNDLATTNPTLASQLVDKDLATTVTAGSKKKLLWRCDLGHEWSSTVSNRSINGSGCPSCYFGPDKGKTLRETHPFIADQLVDGEIADKVSAGSNLRASWKCQLGHQWDAKVYSRVQGHNCPSCAVYGFNPDTQSARLYLVLPPGRHPIGFGKVQSEERYEIAMRDAYMDCLPVAYAVGSGIDVSNAERELKSIKGRPVGKIPRLQTESLPRTCDSIDLWKAVAERHGLELKWLVDLTTIDLVTPPTVRLHANREFCGCSMNGLNRHDSMSSCCLATRKSATELIKQQHYLHAAPGGTIHYFTWMVEGEIMAAMTLGTGSNANGGKSLSTYSGVRALELTRLWASPDLDITLSSFVSRCFDSIEYPLFVYSYADASEGHTGGIYRACSFNYAGWSDMSRRSQLRRKPNDFTPFIEWPVTSAKHRYWKLIGVNGRTRSDALLAAGWPSFDHRLLGYAPRDSHRRIKNNELQQYRIAPR